MRQVLSAASSAVSLLLCAGSCVLWVRSHLRGDVLWRGDGFRVGSVDGAVWYAEPPGVATLIDGDPDGFPRPVTRSVPYPLVITVVTVPASPTSRNGRTSSQWSSTTTAACCSASSSGGTAV